MNFLCLWIISDLNSIHFCKINIRSILRSNSHKQITIFHTLFALEDMYGLKIKDIDGELCLCLDKSNTSFSSLFDMFSSWQQQAAKLEKGEISKDEYDEWRYRYPALDTYSKWARIPSPELSDLFTNENK